MLLIATYFSVFILYVLNFFDDVFLTPLRKYSYFIVLFFAFLLLGFTENSIDYNGYKIYYDTVKTLSNYNTDVLFNFAILIFKYFSFSFEFFYHSVGIINFILLLVILNIFFKTEREKIIFLLCYLSFAFLLKDLIQMRNALALKYFLLSLYFFFRKKGFFVFSLYIMAVLTHNSLLMFVPIFFVHKHVRLSGYLLIFLYAAFFIVYFGNGFIKVLKSIPVFGGRIGSYLAFSSREFDALSLFHFVRICIYLFFFFFFLKNNADKRIRFLLICVTYGYLIRICLIDVSMLSGRLAENTYVLEAFLLAYIFQRPSKKPTRVFKYCFLLLYCAVYIKMIFGNLDFLNKYQSLIW